MADMSDAEYQALSARNQSTDLDNMLTSEEEKRFTEERARRNPAVKANDPRIQKIEFNDQGEVKKPTSQAFGMVSDMLLGAVSPFGDHTAEVSPFGDAAAPEAPTAAPNPAAPTYAPPSQDDQALQAEYLARVASSPDRPMNVNREALQYKLLHPEMSFDDIEQNIDHLRVQAQSDRVNWRQLVQEHPKIAEFIGRDPETMSLALSHYATTSGIGSTIAGLGQQAWHGLQYGGSEMLYGLGQAVQTAGARFFDAVGLHGQASRERDLAKYFSNQADLAQSKARMDLYGDRLKNSQWIVRQLAEVGDTTASLLPYAVEVAGASAASGGAALAPFIFNTLASVGNTFRGAKAKGMSDDEALGRTALGAPLQGAALSLSPLSRAENMFVTRSTQAALERLIATNKVSFGRAAWTVMGRAGIDAASGQIALGLQRAASQLALADSGKEIADTPLEFLRGVADPSLLGFHAFALMGTVGKLSRSANSARKLNQLINAHAASEADPAVSEMNAQVAQTAATEPQAERHLFYNIDQFHSEAERLKSSPRELAAKLMKDGGAAYDVALATRSEHLRIPVERVGDFVKEGLGDSLREHGKFSQDLYTSSEVASQADEIKTAFDAEYAKAAKLDPDTLTGEDAALYRAAQAHATVVGMTDGTAVPRLIAEVRALAKLRPDMTHREIFDGLFGKEGLYGSEAHGKVPEPKVTSEVDANAAPTVYTYRHSDSPMKLLVSDDAELADHRSATYLLGTGADDAKIYEGLRGKGYATQTYLQALIDAQKAGKGWASDRSRSDASDRMYERLIGLGLPFKLVKNEGEMFDRYVLSPKDLAGVDVRLLLEKLTGEAERVRPADLIEQAQALTGHGDDRWFDAFQTDQEKRSAFEAAAKADAQAADTLKEALVKNDRRFMDKSREDALDEAKRVAAKHPVLQAIRAIRGDHGGLSPEQRANLVREDGKPFRLLASQIDSLLGPGAAEALKAKLGDGITKDPKKAMDARDMAQVLGFEHTPQGLAEKNMLWAIRETPDEKTFVEQTAQNALDSRYGPDLLTNPAPLMGAALDAVHTPAATDRLLGLYRRLANGLDPTTKARSAMTSEMWHAHAERLLGLKEVGEIDPHYFANAEGRAVQRALDAADGAKGQDGTRRMEAARHAESAVLYHHLYLAAREASDTLGRAQRKLQRSADSELPVKRLGKADPNAGPDGLNDYQRAREGVLVALGLLPERAGTDYSGSIDKMIKTAASNAHNGYLTDGVLWHPDTLQKIVDNKSGWGSLTPDEARQATAFVANLDRTGLTIEKSDQGGGLASLSTSIENWVTNDGIRKPKNPLWNDRNLQTREGATDQPGALRNFFRAFGWTDTPGNWGTDYLLRRLGPGGELLADQLRKAIIDRHEIMDPRYKAWRDVYDQTMKKNKERGWDPFAEAAGAVEELKPDLGQADNRKVSYAWLVNLARWWGDADGRDRILKGFKLTPDRVEAVLEKYLPAWVHDAIQGEKDLIAKDWTPLLMDKELQRTGSPLRLSQPSGYAVHGKEYKGGHVTLSYDDRAGMGLDPRRALGDASLGSFKHDAVGFHRATMESGFLQERAGLPDGARPDLNSLTAPQTMADMAHHLAVGDWLLQATQVLLNPNTIGVIERYVGAGSKDAIQGLLMRTASEMRGGPERIDPATRESIQAFRSVRNALVTAMVTGKVTIPIMHLTHPFIVGHAMHGPMFAVKYTLPAFVKMMNDLPNWMATGNNDFVKSKQDESPYLRQRSSDTPQDIADLYFDREMQKASLGPATKMKIMEGVQNFSSAPLRVMDEIFSAVIHEAEKTWAIDQKMDTQSAIEQADRVTFRSMPNYAPHARSGYSSGRGFQTMINAFMGYYATVRDLKRSTAFDNIDRDLRGYETEHGKEAPLWFRANKSMKWEAAAAIPVVLGLGMSAYLGGKRKEDEGPEWLPWEAGYWQRDFGEIVEPLLAGAAHETTVRLAELQAGLGFPAERAVEAIEDGFRRRADLKPSQILYSPFDSVATAADRTFSPRWGPGDAALAWGKASAGLWGLPIQPLTNIGGTAVNYEEWMDNLPTSKSAQAIDFVDRLTYPHYYGRAARYANRTPLSDLKNAVQHAVETDKGAKIKLPW